MVVREKVSGDADIVDFTDTYNLVFFNTSYIKSLSNFHLIEGTVKHNFT